MTGKIFRSILSIAAGVLLTTLIVITGFLYNYFSKVQANQLKDELTLAATATEDLGITYLEDLKSDRYRLTLVADDGKVIYDTKADAATMENHLNRTEIIDAFKYGKSSSARQSSTLSENTLYEAIKLSNNTVLRISISQTSASSLILGMLAPIIIIAIVVIILSGVLAAHMAKRITDPLNKLNLEAPLDNNSYEELSPLLNRIHHQHKEIDNQLKDLQQSKAEFNQVTDNMKEGLILLDNSRKILSINPAAQKLFDVNTSCIGENILTVDRKYDLNLAIDEAFANGESQIRTTRQNKQYQFDISRIENGSDILGAVLLSFDITQKANAERARREFSANVSHELKTPLQSIIGSAELIENGLVKAEDLPQFIGRIRSEAFGLVSLVEDIIRLSQLDEKVEFPTENVSLFELTNDILSNLSNIAKEKNITLSVSGDKGNIDGIHRLLYEIIYNLCDNAIKYNVDGGKIFIKITDKPEETIFQIKDTGIGIPQEDISHVFERFYRVDKSHSKKHGGTGLGLSIVKHAVLQHGGKINIYSNIGKGTLIIVSFPK